MKRWFQAIVALLCAVSTTIAVELELTQDASKQQRCNGMYSQGSWGGSIDPFILTTFDNTTVQGDQDALISFVIFEWKDEHLLGIVSEDPEVDTKEIICYQDNVDKGYCNQTQLGEFILQLNATDISKSPIKTQAINLKNPSGPINYGVKKTGYYCVWTYGFSAEEYRATVTFRNAYGELPAAQIPKLPFYGGLTLVYAVLGAFWAFLYVQNRHDILPVQNYITAIIVFLIVEQLMTWGFYDYQNRHGNNLGNKVLMIVTAVLNAGRNSFSFFLLLIVCMGYGVVKDSLGKTMIYVRILALTHFVFGVIYGVASLSITPDSAGPLVLLVIMPLAASLTAFYVWTLNSLSYTMKDLFDRKQTVKGMMYKKLWWCILGSIMVIFAFFFFNSFSFASHRNRNFVPNHWQTRWFILDGWLNLVYLFDIAFVAYLWRPTVNNRRFAMSDELAQEDDGFEIASFGGEDLDEDDDDPETGRSYGNRKQPSDRSGELLPMPPKPIHERHSLDGETIFAVGEDGDKWSDDEDDEPKHGGERKGLAGKV